MATKMDARLDVRLPGPLKELIQQAADLSGQTVSDFVVSTLTEKARRMVQQERLTILSDRDRDRFLKMLDADIKPNSALRRAAKWYQKQHGRMED